MTPIRFSPPSPLHSGQATYFTDPTSFLSAARLAAARIEHSTGHSWRLDGWRSDCLYLRLSYAELAEQLRIPPYLDVEFDLSLDTSTVTVSVLTRSADTRDLFDQFTDHLDHLLPRSTP
jgi:hypothetical protein